MKKIFIILLFSSIIVSCNKNKVFEKYEKFDNYDWNMDYSVKFEVPIKDTATAYNIFIPVRHVDNYPYDCLMVCVTIITPVGEERTKKHKLNFRDSAGKFLGDGAGDIWDEKTLIMGDIKFKNTGIYKFEILNNMPKTPTQGIMELGLLVEKSK